MIWLYRLIFWPLFIILLPGYLIRLWKRGGKWRVAERFGIINPPSKKQGVNRIWIHAVSVGELNAIQPLLEALKERKDVEIVLSTTTTTGFTLAEKKFKNLVSYLFTFPIDIFAKYTWKRLQPDKLILMEGELWPETLLLAQKNKVPVYLINARLSDRSFKRMLALKGAMQWLLRKVNLILTATKQDTERYLALTSEAKKIIQTGSLKFDAVQSKPIAETKRKELLQSLGFSETDRIIVGSSTWPKEEEALLEAFKKIRNEIPNLRLLLVPRHAERRGEIEDLLKQSGLNYHRRMAGPVNGSPEIVLADTTGELSFLLQLASVVFVGKSLPPHKEGQTPIEPAAAAKPIIMGHGMGNFRLIAQSLVEEKGGMFVGNPEELKQALRNILLNDRERLSMADRAKTWFENNQGATAKTLEYL